MMSTPSPEAIWGSFSPLEPSSFSRKGVMFAITCTTTCMVHDRVRACEALWVRPTWVVSQRSLCFEPPETTASELDLSRLG